MRAAVATFPVAPIVAAASIAAAQAPARPAAPPRDRPPISAGSAVIRGRIVAADTGRPLALAAVAISAPQLTESRSISSNFEGRYELKNLPGGRYPISVSRRGFLALRYGQLRPMELGRVLQIGDGQIADGIDFMLPRMSAISGRIVDELGDPVENVPVSAGVDFTDTLVDASSGSAPRTCRS